jgi:hypothetical protein
MEELDALHEFGRELEKRIRLQTFPLAVKVLRRENEIPAEAFRPMSHSGYRRGSFSRAITDSLKVLKASRPAVHGRGNFPVLSPANA